MLLDGFYKVLLGIVWRIEVKIGRDWEGLEERMRSKLLIFLFELLGWKSSGKLLDGF